jgi:hypothetical protein
VTHSKGRIKYYELWNEPNLASFWTGSIEQLVQMSHDASVIIRRIDPNAKIVSPSMIPTWAPNWLQAYLTELPKGDLDVISFHAYAAGTSLTSAKPETMVPVIALIRSEMNATGYGGYPLWDTETGWGTNDVLSNSSSSSVQRAMVARYLILQAQAGVARAYWYAYADPQWGTLSSPASGPKAGAQAMGQVMSWLIGATFDGPCRSSEGLWSCDISRPGGYQARILWSDNGSSSVATPSGFGHVRLLDGTSQELGGRVAIGAEPVLIERTKPAVAPAAPRTTTTTAVRATTSTTSTSVPEDIGAASVVHRSRSSRSPAVGLVVALVAVFLAGAGTYIYRRRLRGRSQPSQSG